VVLVSSNLTLVADSSIFGSDALEPFSPRGVAAAMASAQQVWTGKLDQKGFLPLERHPNFDAFLDKQRRSLIHLS
jgi:hypothetical protein